VAGSADCSCQLHKPFTLTVSYRSIRRPRLGVGINLSLPQVHRLDLFKMKSNRKSKLLFALGSFVWLVAISTGLGLVSRYANSAGARGEPPAEWPAESKVARIAGLPTLLLFLHPHCPCSRATIGELAILMAHSQGLVQANAVFVKPVGFTENWEKTDLWASAASIPGVKVTIDDNGLEARKFRSLTSGQATLYSADGRLLFSGGITASRGHSGDNAGRTAIVSLLTEGTAEQKETSVFGCALFEASPQNESEEFCHAKPGQ
jgi:hypothetical protein